MSSRTKTGSASAAEILAKRASLRVKLSKFLGLGAGVVGLSVLAAFLLQSGFFENFVAAPEAPPEVIETPTQISGTNSRISGIDKNNQPYIITSQKGLQDKDSSNLVHLETVTGVFHRANDKQINLASKSAIYDTKSKDMAMTGDVVFEDPGRYKAQMQKAHVNLDDKSLVSQSPVRVDMSNGTVEADSMEIMDNGKRSLFKGHVKAKMDTNSDSGGGE
jgi:lipopolysaccharide export system protein LptC